MSQTEWQLLQELLGKLSREEKETVLAQLNTQSGPELSTITNGDPSLSPDELALAQKQKLAMLQFIHEMEQIPDSDDGFSGEDHDSVLYGSNP